MSMPLMGCNDIKFDPKSMTMEEHADLVYERVQQYYMSENSKYKNTYTDFEVFPLYNQNDELTHFVVEFEPYGFVYLKINKKADSIEELYIRDLFIGDSWQRYTINEAAYKDYEKTDDRPPDFIYELDKNGDFIYRYNSHYKEAGIEREKRYVLNFSFMTHYSYVNYEIIPAVKRGDKWLNLISMEIFELKDEPLKQAYMDCFFPPFDFFI